MICPVLLPWLPAHPGENVAGLRIASGSTDPLVLQLQVAAALAEWLSNPDLGSGLHVSYCMWYVALR
jgi:hypothetical protein